MSEREAFGPNLRRWRLRRGISLEEIAQQTRVGIDLWEGLERNDFTQWPSGIYARAYMREYATAIGVDPIETVNDFCRGFPQGDRRAEPVVRGAAEIVGHQLTWQDDVPAAVHGDRRASIKPDRVHPNAVRHMRSCAAIVDLSAVVLTSGAIVAFFPVSIWIALTVVGALYHAVSLAFAGSTPAVWAIDAYVNAHPGFMRARPSFLFRRLEGARKDGPSLQRPTS